MRPIIYLLLFALLTTSVLVEAKETKEEVDYLGLAALLVRDKHFDRAEQALSQLNPQDESLDRVRYYTLFGLVYLNTSQLEKAITAFEAAIASGQTEPGIYVYIAQAHFVLKHYQLTLDALAKAGSSAETSAQLFVMKAEAYWQLKLQGDAWTSLNVGLQKFPESRLLQKQKISYLLELALFEEAETAIPAFLKNAETENDFLWIAGTLRSKHQPKRAAFILEQANMIYPQHERVMIELANAYLDQQKLIVAAAIFEDLSLVNSKYSNEASELYRRANKPYQALVFNAMVDEQSKKLKQRLAILLEMEDYDMAAAMAGALFRVGLLEDQDIRYALAYSLFKTGEFAAVESHLKQITRSDLFRKSTELRRLMEECRKSRWSCI